MAAGPDGSPGDAPDGPPDGPSNEPPGDVLLVDDDATLLQMLVTLFELEGLQVITAGDGADALAMVRAAPPSALVCDVSMPGVDGLEVCRRLKTDPETRDLPVVLLTAYGGPKAQAAGEAVGCDAFLTKPFDPLELLELIRGFHARPVDGA